MVFVERPAKSPLAYVFLYVAMLANGCRPARAIVSTGMNGITLSLPVSGNSVYIHLISMMPVVSVLRPASDVVPGWAREQPIVAALWFLLGPPPHESTCPSVRSNSRPMTAFTRPTSNVKSGRNRVLAYHSWSLSRE